MMKRVFRFEVRKLLSDRDRLLLITLLFCFACGAGFFVVYHWLGDGSANYHPPYSEAWSPDIERLFETLRDKSYQNYLIAIGKADFPEGSLIHIMPDKDSSWQNYLYYDAMLRIKNTRLWEGYSVRNCLFPSEAGYSDYLFLSTARLFYFQDCMLMFLPVVMCFEIYHVFVRDKAIGFDKNYRHLHVKKSTMFRTRVLFAAIEHLFLFTLMMMVNCVFISGDEMLLFNGETFLTARVVGVFFMREAEMYLCSLSLLFALILISLLLTDKHLYFLVAIPVSALLLLGYPHIHQCTTTSISDTKIRSIPFLNVISSDGFFDDRLVNRLLYPMLAISLLLLFSSLRYPVLEQLQKQKRKPLMSFRLHG